MSQQAFTEALIYDKHNYHYDNHNNYGRRPMDNRHHNRNDLLCYQSTSMRQNYRNQNMDLRRISEQEIIINDSSGRQLSYVLIPEGNLYEMNNELFFIHLDKNNKKSYNKLIIGDDLFIDSDGNKYILADVISKPKSKKNSNNRDSQIDKSKHKSRKQKQSENIDVNNENSKKQRTSSSNKNKIRATRPRQIAEFSKK